jgi:hypothetical protein
MAFSEPLMSAAMKRGAFDSAGLDAESHGAFAMWNLSLKGAQQRGYEAAFLQSSDLGKGVYGNLGFFITDFGFASMSGRGGKTYLQLRTRIHDVQ